MAEEVTLEFRLRKIDETRNYLVEEVSHSDLMTENYKKTCKHVKHLVILVSKVTSCLSISAFTSLVCVPGGITSSALEIKICQITAGIKNYKSIIMKNKKKLDKIVLLGKDKLNTIKVFLRP